MGLLIDLLEQPRPCIPAKLVRYATAAPKLFFQRMSLEISCSLKTGPVRHFKRAGKRLVGFKPLSTHMSCTPSSCCALNGNQYKKVPKFSKPRGLAYNPHG